MPQNNRDAAAACLSSLLTRPDMEASHLRRFLEVCNRQGWGLLRQTRLGFGQGLRLRTHVCTTVFFLTSRRRVIVRLQQPPPISGALACVHTPAEVC